MNARTYAAALVVAFLTAVVPVTWADTAQAARPQPQRGSLDAMARFYHCDIVATPGPDYFHGKVVRGWLIGEPQKGYFHIDPALVGWEPHGRDWVKAACQF